MKPLFIEGIGILFNRGRGLDKFEAALREGWKPPGQSKDGRAAYRIAPEDLTDRETLKGARRADRFSKLTVLAARDAIRDSGFTPEEIQGSTGIIVATAFGAHSTIFKFLDNIIDYGERNVSPTTFAHSIHNAAASYAAGVTGCKGPAITLTQFHFSFHQALLLAYAWLHEGRVERVLVGTADECSPAMEYICAEKLDTAADGKMDPLSCLERPRVVPGEGSAFFLVSLDPAKKKYGAFSEIEMGRSAKGWSDVDLSIAGAHGMSGSEKVYQPFLEEGPPVAAFSQLYGSLMTGSAFDCAAAALMLERQVQYAGFCPVRAGASKVNEGADEKLSAIQCIAHNCEGELAFLKLVR